MKTMHQRVKSSTMGKKNRLKFAIYTSCQPISKILIRYFALLTFLTAIVLGIYTVVISYYPSQLPVFKVDTPANKEAPPSKNAPRLTSKIEADLFCSPLTESSYSLTDYDLLQPAGSCVAPVCQLNLERERIKVDIQNSKYQCDTVQSCVTFIVKTRFRFGMVTRLVNSIHRLLQGARIIVADDVGNPKNGSDLLQSLTSPQDVRYILVPPKVGYGIKLAMMQTQTPYVFIIDDDHMFSKDTDISRLVNVLQHTDASLVSINHATENRDQHQGVLRVAQTTKPSQPMIQLYYNVFHEMVPCFPTCYVADITKPVFLADKDAILNMGGWDETIIYWGNEDFFFALRRSALKVVYCDDVSVIHRPLGGALEERKTRIKPDVTTYVNTKWGIAGVAVCGPPSTYYDVNQCKLHELPVFKPVIIQQQEPPQLSLENKLTVPPF